MTAPISVSVHFEEGDSENYDGHGLVIDEENQAVRVVGADSSVLADVGCAWKVITIDKRRG